MRFTCPRNFAPTAGPTAPSSHCASNVSGLNRPICVTSLINDHTASGEAFISTVAKPCMARPYPHLLAPRNALAELIVRSFPVTLEYSVRPYFSHVAREGKGSPGRHDHQSADRFAHRWLAAIRGCTWPCPKGTIRSSRMSSRSTACAGRFIEAQQLGYQLIVDGVDGLDGPDGVTLGGITLQADCSPQRAGAQVT